MRQCVIHIWQWLHMIIHIINVNASDFSDKFVLLLIQIVFCWTGNNKTELISAPYQPWARPWVHNPSHCKYPSVSCLWNDVNMWIIPPGLIGIVNLSILGIPIDLLTNQYSWAGIGKCFIVQITTALWSSVVQSPKSDWRILKDTLNINICMCIYI